MEGAEAYVNSRVNGFAGCSNTRFCTMAAHDYKTAYDYSLQNKSKILTCMPGALIGFFCLVKTFLKPLILPRNTDKPSQNHWTCLTGSQGNRHYISFAYMSFFLTLIVCLDVEIHVIFQALWYLRQPFVINGAIGAQWHMSLPVHIRLKKGTWNPLHGSNVSHTRNGICNAFKFVQFRLWSWYLNRAGEQGLTGRWQQHFYLWQNRRWFTPI